jgi:hypothetical protein
LSGAFVRQITPSGGFPESGAPSRETRSAAAPPAKIESTSVENTREPTRKLAATGGCSPPSKVGAMTPSRRETAISTVGGVASQLTPTFDLVANSVLS